jgi:hypothetical protein
MMADDPRDERAGKRYRAGKADRPERRGEKGGDAPEPARRGGETRMGDEEDARDENEVEATDMAERHHRERRDMHTRHEREHRDMTKRHTDARSRLSKPAAEDVLAASGAGQTAEPG